MSLEHILLGCLKAPASGYDLKTYFDHNIRQFWSAELSQIYPTLKRLEARGLLTSQAEASTKGPARTVYTRTAAGRDALLAWLASGPQMGTERFAYLAQVYFMHELDDVEATRRFIVELRARLAAWRAALEDVERDIRDAASGPLEEVPTEELHPFIAVRMGIHSIGAKVAWCDETVALLNARLAATPTKEEAS